MICSAGSFLEPTGISSRETVEVIPGSLWMDENPAHC